jgi:signal transduction histidine kinase
MGELLGNVAHQWRQPLNALALVLANLEDDAAHFAEPDRAVVARAVADGQGLIQKMSGTINMFRDFFNARREKSAFSAQALIRETVALVDASFLDSGVEIRVEVSDDALLHADRSEYSQVLLSLLSNARQAILAARHLRGLITVSFGTRGTWACLSVRDDGPGVPNALLERIFEPYFSTWVGSAGLGLYTARQLVERGMGGRIELHNVEGGAELLVLTPLAPTSEATTSP